MLSEEKPPNELTGARRRVYFKEIANQLIILMDNHFEKSIKTMVSVMFDYKIDELHEIYKRLSFLNTLPKNHPKVLKYKTIYKRMILSINNLEDADSHPLGLYLSISLYSESAQETLNVKHLTTTKDSNNIETKTEDEQFVNSLGFEYSKKIPSIDVTLLYSNVINWVRVRLVNDSLDLVKKLVEYRPYSLQLTAIYRCTDTIWEFYFTDKQVLDCMEYFLGASEVSEIIFYSNCKLLKAKCGHDILLFMSNTIKFLYCYLNSMQDLSIRNQQDINKLFNCYMLSTLFTYKDNMKTNHSEKLTTPLTALSGTNPKMNVQSKLYQMEPLTSYDKIQLQQSSTDLRATSMSNQSIKFNMRHVIHELANDRDHRLSGRGSIIGGRSIHELVIDSIKPK